MLIGSTPVMNTKDKVKRLLAEQYMDKCRTLMGDRPRLFLSPPLDSELLAAIKRIAPHLGLNCDEWSRELWELDQNASSLVEFEVMSQFISASRLPRILELGAGLGRSLIYLAKSMDWHAHQFHVYDASGAGIPYSIGAERNASTFCSDLVQLRRILDYNGLAQVTVHDANTCDLSDLADLGAPYDVIYSFFSVGYHWHISDFLDDLRALMTESSVGLFGIPSSMNGTLALPGFEYELLPIKYISDVPLPMSLLVLRKLS
jgi:hypothetical protein